MREQATAFSSLLSRLVARAGTATPYYGNHQVAVERDRNFRKYQNRSELTPSPIPGSPPRGAHPKSAKSLAGWFEPRSKAKKNCNSFARSGAEHCGSFKRRGRVPEPAQKAYALGVRRIFQPSRTR